jgi:hypothetical protein
MANDADLSAVVPLPEALNADQLHMTLACPSPEADPTLVRRGREETLEERAARIVRIREEKKLKQVVTDKRRSLRQRCGMEEEGRRRAKQKSMIAAYFTRDDPHGGK